MKQNFDFSKLTSLHQKSYGAWAGNNAGHAPDPKLCCESVSDSGRSMLTHQCRRKRGWGPEGAYCKQHSPESVAARRADEEARYQEKRLKWKYEANGEPAVSLLKQIAEGHNDPRSAAQEFLKKKGFI